MSTRPRKRATTIAWVVAGLLVTSAAATGLVLAFNDTGEKPSPAVTEPRPTPDLTPPAAPEPAEPTDGPWRAEPIHDGLVTPPGVNLLGPAQTIEEGAVRGWYAAAEVVEGTDLDAVVDDLLFQLSELGAPGTFAEFDGGVTITASGHVDGTDHRYEIQILHPDQGQPAQVLILAATQEVAQ